MYTREMRDADKETTRTERIEARQPCDRAHTRTANGLTLRVDGSGGRRWVLRVTVDGKQVNRGLGSYPAVTLSAARAAAASKRRAVKRGDDPVKVTPKSQRPDMPTFQEVANTKMDLIRPTWTNKRIGQQWESSLRMYVYPVIGGMPVDKVTPPESPGDSLSGLARQAGNIHPVEATHGDHFRLRRSFMEYRDR